MEREPCLRPVAPGGWMSGLKPAAAKKPGPTQHRSSHIQALAPLGCAVSQVVKTAQSRGRTERTLLFAVALAGRSTASPAASRGAAGQAECRGQARPVPSDVTLLFPTPNSSRRQALMSCRWLAAVARVNRTDARSSRAVVKTALTCGFLFPK
jgi:hypothetical protein